MTDLPTFDVEKVETPFDHPTTLWERLIFPSLRMAYRSGFDQGSIATVDKLAGLGWEFGGASMHEGTDQ